MTDPFRFIFRARLLEVHDGDTVKLSLDRGLDGTETPEWIRLGGPGVRSPLNVYAPELSEPGGIECQHFAAAWLAVHDALPSASGWPLVVETWKTSGDLSKTTLGRYLGNVTDAATGESLNLAVAAFVTARGYGHGVGS
jgi:hypothetical protein